MNYQYSRADAPRVRVDQQRDVAHVVLANGPGGNALDLETASALRDALHAVTTDSAVRTIVLRGEGERFCVGGDLRAFERAPMGENLCDAVARPLHEAIEMMQASRQPVVCVVHGAVGGGANGLVLAADIVLAARGTTFRLGYTGSGLSPDCGVTWELPRRMGRARAMDLVLTNRRVDADEAVSLGLVSRVVEPGQLDEVLQSVLAALAAVPVETLSETKRLLARASSNDLHSHLEDEARTIGRIGDTADTREAISAFLAKRPPTFSR